jgi:uracil-DNA glycosylase family 4
MNLKDEIKGCKKCPLYSNMLSSPISPEWVGSPKIMFVITPPVKEENDFFGESIVGLNRIRFLQLLEEASLSSYFITSLVKCKPIKTTYTKKNIEDCKGWLVEEFNRLNPNHIVFCGKTPSSISSLFKKYTETHAINKIVSNRQNEQEFKDLISRINSGN